MKKTVTLCFFFIVLFFSGHFDVSAALNPINPVLPGDRPDPSVIKIGDEYWAIATSNEWSPLFPIFKSKDLNNWELVSYVFPKGAPKWALNNFWAPELSYDETQNKVYVYYTARDKSSNRLSCAVAVASSPEGPYKGLGPLVAQEPGSIDAFAVRDENGKLYLLWKEDGNSMGRPTTIWAQEMTEDRKKLVGEMHALIVNDTPWEEGLVEGVCVFRKDGYFYAIYSAAGCCDKNCNYKTGVARSKTLLGKWEKYQKNPILVDNADWKCPGHGTVVENGGDLYYLYHAYNRNGSVYVGREGVLEKIYWTADGWPYFKNDASYNRKNESLDFTDTFTGKTLNPLWQWRVTQKIKFSTGEKGLCLYASHENKDLGSLLVQPIKALNFTLEATVGLQKEPAAAGIAIIGGANNGFGAPLAGIGISATKEKINVWKTINGETTVLSEVENPNGEQSDIRMAVSDGYKLVFSYKSSDGKWIKAGNEIDASPYVPWGMGFRIGLVAKGDKKCPVYFKKVSLKNGTVKRLEDYTYQDVPFTNVHFTDKFWAGRIETVRNVTVPFAFDKCEETGRIDNFAIAGKLKEGRFNSPYPFDDSDVYKIMEGAAYLLAVEKDPELDAYMDSLIYLIGKAQEPDGYLYTNRTISNPLHPWAAKHRWENERDNSHELYNVGHMYEAAVAHYKATGKRTFLDIAIKNANLLCETFGPEPGKITVAPGHQEVELALVKLYRATGDTRYLNLSKFFLDARGKYEGYDRNSKDQFRCGAYWQDHLPVTQQDEAVGHAVRAGYMYAAMTDIAALKDDSDYLKAVDKLWNNVVGKKLYITGGVGATRHGEAFGRNYELPNSTAYCETCAAIANCMWNLRMFMLHGDSKYIDILERSLYNGVLSGLELDGSKFFYPNVLSCDKGGSLRSPWFDCSCCPSNLARFIPSVPGYVYSVSDKGMYVNLYGANTADVVLKTGTHLRVAQSTEYPWDGKIKLAVEPDKIEAFDVMLRIPGWVRDMPVGSDLYAYTDKNIPVIDIYVNGEKVDYDMQKGYAVLSRIWQKGDIVEFALPMDVHKVLANEQVEADRGYLSIERGPIVYCAEFADNKGEVMNFLMNENQKFDVQPASEMFDGVVLLKDTDARRIVSENNYTTIKEKEDTLTLIPYYARSHRGTGEMTVWFPYEENIIRRQLIDQGRIVDKVIIGNEVSEKKHQLKGENTHSGGGADSWRDASNGGWFSYVVKVDGTSPMELVLTYNSTDGGNREFDILVDNRKIADQKLRAETYSALIEKVYPIPSNLTRGKKKVVVKLKALPGMTAGGIFGLRVQKTLK